MTTNSSRDVQEIVSKLSSDKARTREEGIKLLSTWLEGERSIAFCRHLRRSTAALKPNEIPHAETWPFLVTLLIDCALSEISLSKRRVPKIMYAKSLRFVVQRAEDQKGCGDELPLITVVKSLFSHLWDVLREVPSFQSEYSIILRHLLSVKDYRFHMRKKVYCGLILLYLENIEACLSQKSFRGANPKEELSRFILTLHSLLENPPGDFPGTIRDAVVRGFKAIFASLREEGKVLRKLIECLNTYLVEDGPNLGSQSLEIHDSVQQFLFHCWLTTPDRTLKDTLVTYASLQLKLMRDSKNGGALVEQLSVVVRRELDLNCVPNSGAARSEAVKDEKFGTLTSSQLDLVDLAALVFYWACKHTNEEQHVEKRAKRENLAGYLKGGLVEGKWLWHAAFCCFIKKYHTRIGKNLLAFWSDTICSNFERIMNDANTDHAYDGLLWTLRSLQELCSVLICQFAVEKNSLYPSFTSNKISFGWKTLWSCVMRGLPTLSNIAPIVDATFILLGTFVSNDLFNIMIVPNEVWDLKCFKNITSVSVLYFISCYFSRKGSQGDLRDNLQLRKNIMCGILDFAELKASFTLDKDLVILLPAAILALCAGTYVIPHGCKMLFAPYSPGDPYGGKNLCDGKPERLGEHVEFCSDLLTEVNLPLQFEVSSLQDFQAVHLPKLLRDSLLHEMECRISVLVDGKLDKKSLSNIFLQCALISYFLDGSFKARLREETSTFCSTSCQYLLDLMHSALLIVQESIMDVKNHGCLSSNFAVSGTYPAAVSLNIFLQSPFFISSDGNAIDGEIYGSVIDSIEKFLKGLCSLYLEFSHILRNQQSETISIGASSSSCPVEGASSMQNSNSSILDMDLDVNDAADDAIIHVESGTGHSLSGIRWKMDMVALMESCFPVLPAVTWDMLFDILKNEDHSKVCQPILLSLCENPHWSSSERLHELVTLINEMTELRVSSQLHCLDIVATISCLLRNLLPMPSLKKYDHCHPSPPMQDINKSLECLRNLVDQISGSKLLDWHGRVKLIDCICNFIHLNPVIGQAMIEKLLILLHDDEYRVRLFLARRIGVLFETWDGHSELFLDICFNFGIKLVVPSREKLVTVAEVLADGPQPSSKLETVIITLMHIALYSDKMEFQAVFMICSISAIYPSQRQLVKLALDNLAKQLQYACRSKYLDELMRCILFWWVPCGVSLPALVEMRDLFVLDVEVKHFIQYCCPWLLSSLMLHDDASNLDWIAQVTGQPIPDLLENNFVPVFSICMTLHCSKKSGWDMALLVLQNSFIKVAKITEDDRDKLIKKNLVSIVSFILGLSSNSPDSAAPFFSSETVQFAIRSVVDGFLDMEACRTNTVVVDKMNIFRPDRVFALIVEIHYKVSTAVSQRHRCHRLSAIEVLIDIIGHRAATASTSCYLFNLACQFISCHTLQDQCCRMISTLLAIYKSNTSRDTSIVFGEQLQFLVSRLVVCCIPSDAAGHHVIKPSSQVLSLLHLLTVDADPSLHVYIRELEPFPELDMFDAIRKFHMELCNDQSPRDQFLKFVKRSINLPPRLLLWSLQALHSRLLGEIFCAEDKKYSGSGNNYNHRDNEVVEAVWSLVHMCGSSDAVDIQALVADFISRVGIGDPHSTVFHLPGNLRSIHVCGSQKSSGGLELSMNAYCGVSEELLISLMRILKKYLIDESVQIVDFASQALRGILSTERGQRALLSFDSYERSLLEVHSKGVNVQRVEHCLRELERKFSAEGKSLDDSTLWSTVDKTFETWICPLVYSLIGYCDDTILRLCQDIVLLKAEFAEVLLPNVMVNLAGKKDLDVKLCKMISLQVQKYILVETNMLIKSTQATLNALNEVRLYHVIERSGSVALPGKQDSSKLTRLSAGYNSRSSKVKDSAATLNAVISPAWDKVYWLSIDYLAVAKAAITCGSYFTSVMYVEHWCEENFKNLTLGDPDFSHREVLPHHVDILLAAITRINEPDSLYGIVQSHKINSQTVTFEHENNWSKALQYYDLQVRSAALDDSFKYQSYKQPRSTSCTSSFISSDEIEPRKPYKGLIRSLQQTGCAHILDLYSQGLVSRNSEFQQDQEFVELQYEAAWRAGNWDYSLLYLGAKGSSQYARSDRFHESLHSCLRALQEGDPVQFQVQLRGLKQGLVLSVNHASEERTEYIYAAIIKLQILDHLTVAWDLRWNSHENSKSNIIMKTIFSKPNIPTLKQLSVLDAQWRYVLKQTQMNMNLLEPFVAFRRVLLQVLDCKDSILQHLLKSSAVLRKGSRFPQATSALHDLKFMSYDSQDQLSSLYWLGRLEEAKLLRAQGQTQMAINLGKYLVVHNHLTKERSDVYRLVGKWLAETRSSNSRTILEEYLKPAVSLAEELRSMSKKTMARQCRTYFHLAHYADALFKSHDERLNSSEWQAAMRLRKHKTLELEALVKRIRSTTKGQKTDYSIKIQELQKQLMLDKEEAEKLQVDRDKFLNLALDGYKRCLVVGDKYDVRVVFRLISLWFSLSSRQNVVNSMLSTIKEVQSHKFIPLVYQIASRMGGPKEVQGPGSFQFALVSLVKKMAIDHPYHTILQLLALANGDRIKDKQRSRNSFVVDMDKKHAAEKLLEELSDYHGLIIKQMKLMVEVYIKLAELETKREDTNRKMQLPRDIRSLKRLELVPVVTANIPVDPSCQYHEGSFPHFIRLADSVTIMNGINAPKVVECFGSDGKSYRQLAKSGNDDLRQDAVMEQFFSLVNTFLQNNRDTWKRKLGVRTYKVVPFTPSAGVIEWVNGTLPLGEYLIGSTRSGGAHGRYGTGDWSFPKCREHMMNAKDKRREFQEVCEKFRPVMHYFFLERFWQPADWFEKRLAYTRSVAASSMVGYIVGLGDRHSMNILIDQATAEVVHIDLGVAFEQGLMLKTPERVPFRLTRDIIDGMGVTGVEGVFRRCAEETLSVMRTNKEALLTIIEVFIHDPLYKWALSPLKALQRQNDIDDDLETTWDDSQDDHEGNKDATRALLRVKQKLDGYEEGEMRSLHGQVQQLIQDAIDPERLCQMFPGWAAWM